VFEDEALVLDNTCAVLLARRDRPTVDNFSLNDERKAIAEVNRES
jgi:hypothetical protein